MRTSYSVERKLEVLSWHRKNGGVIHKTAKEFKVDRKRIREWISKESLLQQHCHGASKKKCNIGSGRKPLSEEMDEELYEFLEVERSAGRAVSNCLLKLKAKEIAEQLGLKDFKASDPFIANWKKRFNVVMRVATNDSQKTPEDLAEQIKSFHQNVKIHRWKNDYTPYNIRNMDQTMVRFDCPARRTNNVKGETTIRITNTGCAKRGFTVALCGAASGHKFPAFCVFKEPTGRIPPKVFAALKIPKNVRVVSSLNGWMTANNMKQWIGRVLGENEDDVRRLLILDQAPIHVTSDVRDTLLDIDIDLVLIPGGCTRLVQPADVSWNKPFKAKLRVCWEEYMRKETRTPKGNFKKPSRQDVIDWVSVAWSAVSEEVVERSFKLCGVSNALDGSQNGEFHDSLARAAKPSSDELEQELIDLLFDEEDNESFDGFSDVEV